MPHRKKDKCLNNICRMAVFTCVVLLVLVGCEQSGLHKVSQAATEDFDVESLQRILDDEYAARDISANLRDDYPLVESTAEQIKGNIHTNGWAIASAMSNGMVEGELSGRFAQCPEAVVTLIDSSASSGDRIVNIDLCVSNVKELSNCTVPLDNFLEDPIPCMSSLGMPGAIMFSKLIPNCKINRLSPSCNAYNRMAAQVTYMLKALRVTG
jgi:hypothetical protein